MKTPYRSLLLAALMLALAGHVAASEHKAEPAKEEKKDDKKDEKPAEPELPSKPYPKDARRKVTPAAAAKPADKPAEKPAEKPADKAPAAEKVAEKAVEKPVELAAVAPAPKKKPKPVAPRHEPAPDPALRAVFADAVAADAHGQSPQREPYVVKQGDTLDRVAKKTLPTTPFSPQVVREAFVKANPQAFPDGRPTQKLRAGTSMRIPDASIFRLVVLGEAGADDHGSHGMHGAPRAEAPAVLAVPPRPVLSAAPPAGEVSAEEKKKWVRFP